MPITISPTTAHLVDYLKSVGGSDVHTCTDAKGDPDPLAARKVAEALRERHGSEVGVLISVVQHANRVVVTLLDDSLAKR
ncbi:MAG: hypothetical protein AAB263_21805 [Planctomycetota bacterium]